MKSDLVVSEAARQFFTRLFGLFQKSETEVWRLPFPTRKRIGVSLYAEELAAQLFYGACREETFFLTRVLVPLLRPGHNLIRARLRYATWRLVVRHREAILEWALDLRAPLQASRRMTPTCAPHRARFRIRSRELASPGGFDRNKAVDHEHMDTEQCIKKLEERLKKLEQQIRDLRQKVQTHDHPHTH